jgi:hypothetical protein
MCFCTSRSISDSPSAGGGAVVVPLNNQLPVPSRQNSVRSFRSASPTVPSFGGNIGSPTRQNHNGHVPLGGALVSNDDWAPISSSSMLSPPTNDIVSRHSSPSPARRSVAFGLSRNGSTASGCGRNLFPVAARGVRTSVSVCNVFSPDDYRHNDLSSAGRWQVATVYS